MSMYACQRCAALVLVLTGGLVAGAVSGCSEPTSVEPAGETSTEPSFAEQAAAVRAGTSHGIRVDHSLVTDDDLQRLRGLEDELRHLNLSQTTVNDEGLALIARCTQLEQLRLASSRLTDDGLVSLGKLAQLRHLHLIGAPITDAGIEHLAGLKSLESLYLDDSRVTDEGAHRLEESLPNVHLHVDGAHPRLPAAGSNHEH